jgi:hypothetical protein
MIGALLGADISIKISNGANPLSDNYMEALPQLWSMLYPVTRVFIVFTIALSIIKAIFDGLDDLSVRKERHQQRRFPSPSIISNYQVNILPQIRSIEKNLNEDGTKEFAIQAIYELLSITRDFVSSWDGKNKENYKCNLMFYLEKSQELKIRIRENWTENKQFFDSHGPDTASDQISGILATVASSTYNDHVENQELKKLRNNGLILPVSLPTDTNVTPQSIPGAPQALKDAQTQYLADILEEISFWLYKYQSKYFSPMQAKNIYEYYLKDKTGRSLFCIPCIIPNDVEFNGEKLYSAGDVVAVLNIYSKNINLLNGDPNLFFEFCRPILEILARSYWIIQLANSKNNQS